MVIDSALRCPHFELYHCCVTIHRNTLIKKDVHFTDRYMATSMHLSDWFKTIMSELESLRAYRPTPRALTSPPIRNPAA